MAKKKVLICGIRDFGSRSEGHYYLTKENGEVKFCDGLVFGEGEAKKILSCVEIDEIIAIGSGIQCIESKDGQNADISHNKIKLNEGIELFSSATDSFSDFDFFRYRLAQFVEGVNIDTTDFLDRLEISRREEMIHSLKDIFGDNLSEALPTFSEDATIRDKALAWMKSLPHEEVNCIWAYLYSILDKRYKITAKGNNCSIPISFVPITDCREHKVINRFNNLITELLTEGDTEIELYLDLHGFSLEDSFVCINALYALHEDPNSIIKIRDVVDENITLSGYLYEVNLSSDRYRVQKLMSGINSFIQNGKTDILREYWAESKERNQGQNNVYIDRLFSAMSHVDAGISLCSIDELEKGIYGLRMLFNSNVPQTETDNEGESLLMALREGILKDYGALVEKSGEEIDSIELVKWAYKKKFYQQVITIIESRLPDDIVKRGIFYPAENDTEKLAYLKAMNYHYWDSLSKDRYIFYDIEHYFMKFYGRFAVNYKDKSTDKTVEYTQRRIEQVFGNNANRMLLPAHSLIKDKELLTAILEKYYRLCGIRNTINHACGDKDSVENALENESKIWNDVGKMIEDFIHCYDKALAAIDGQDASYAPITTAEFRDYVYHHGPKMDPGFRNVPGYQAYRDANRRKHSNGNWNRKPSVTGRHNSYKQNHARTHESDIHITVSIAQNKGIGSFIRRLLGKNQETEEAQELSQGNIKISIK